MITALRIAVRALARNKLRSILTMLGNIIGVGAVGEGASGQVQRQIRNLGDDMTWTEAGSRNLDGMRTGTINTTILRWPTEIPVKAFSVPVVFSAAVGMFLGDYPAYKAAHLDPIEALRYE